MLGPKTIPVTSYPTATQPLLGYEQQLFISTQPYTDLGLVTVTGVNSGTYTANTAANALLALAPQELLCILDTPGVVGDSPLIFQVVGTDKNNNQLSGVATYTPPGYAQDRGYDIHQRRAAEVIPYQGGVVVDGTQFKTIASVLPIGASASYLNAAVKVTGWPARSSFIKIGTKVSIEFDEKIQEPVAIQDGKDRGRYIKQGEIPVGTLTISTKDPVSADGIRRYNGQFLTGMVLEKKADVLETNAEFLGNLIITAKPKGAEGQEAVMLEGTGMYAALGAVLAQ